MLTIFLRDALYLWRLSLAQRKILNLSDFFAIIIETAKGFVHLISDARGDDNMCNTLSTTRFVGTGVDRIPKI